MARILRKHATALIALVVFHFVFFFPVIFMGRVVSPNDVFYNFDPWALYRPPAVRIAQNSLMNDPATGYLPMIAMVKRGLETFHWNPYLACGIPGFGSAAAASFTPFILIPILLVPLTWVYTAIILLKLNGAFFFAYLWLREERLGKRGAAIGALVVAAAGVYAIRWLWQMTNATALYPALLWLVRRAFNGRRSAMLVIVLVAISYALAGFPAAMAYGAYLVLAYGLFVAVRFRRIPLKPVARGVLGVVIALAIAIPALVPFGQLIRRTGYLGTRAEASFRHFFPKSHVRAFVEPEYLGNPATKNWKGSRDLGILNNYFEAVVYVGLVTIVLTVLAILNRRARTRWFWIFALAVILGSIFGFMPIANVVGSLPGFRYSALARVVILLPIPAGYLAGAGAAWLFRVSRRKPIRAVAALAIAAVLAADLGVFAGRFYPYLKPADADVPLTPTIQFLKAQTQPFRVAPFFNYFWPNAAELYGVEDLRSHFSSEANYRALMERIDKNARLASSTVMEFNSLTFQFDDPLVSMLGVRYFIEHKAIDIIKWGMWKATVPGTTELGTMMLQPGMAMQRTIRVGEEYSLELPVTVEQTAQTQAKLSVSVIRFGLAAWARDFTPDDIRVMNKIYIPIRQIAPAGEDVIVRVQPIGMRVSMTRGENPNAAEAPLFYARVMTPVMFERELPDGRLFLNVAEAPRFRVAERVRKLTSGEFMISKHFDLTREAIVTDAEAPLPEVGSGPAMIELAEYRPARQRIVTNSARPFFLASSEKLTPELRVEIDGREVRPIEINVLFAGLTVPEGRHEVVFTRRIARGWWWIAFLGAVALMVVVYHDERGRWGRVGVLRRRR